MMIDNTYSTSEGRPRRPANVKKSPFVPGSGLGELSESPLKSEDAFAYSSGLHTDGNQGVRGVDENVNDVTPNDGVGGGYSSKEVVGGDVGDGVGGGVGVSEGNDSRPDIVFVSVGESVITTITQKYYNNKKGENEKVPDVNIDGLPSRYEVLLWHYGRQKQENGERNDFENPGRWRKQARGKKRKKKT
ncbi:hypothetical protein RND71_031915 [Anisodus tanguticus]|uniref:Uncharacterized protein n=1 Tax=Anisodus tanguticus TaxID=243964 RepID=A0AAE1RBL6_9SOLA|nr:hypothetical protein RND71_031915 [Anisodus tanguticus]